MERSDVGQRPVLLTGGGDVAEDLDRLAAAAGCELDRVDNVAALRARWSAAPFVLLDQAGAAQCAAAGLARRDRVVIAVAGAADSAVWRDAVAVGAEHVAALPDGEAWLVGELAEAVEAPGAPGRVVAVLGGRGGAGASVLAAAVAATAAARDRDVLLMDCDPLGGGLDLVLGAEDAEGLRWPGVSLTGGRVAAGSLHAALPAPGAAGLGRRLAVLSCARPGEGLALEAGTAPTPPDPAAVRAVCAAGRRAGETVVCDLPRHPCDRADAALDCADLTVLVVPAEVRACAAAAVLAERLTRLGAEPGLVVRGPAPGGLTPGDVAQALGLPLVTGMRPQPGLLGTLDRGQPPGRGRGPLATAAAEVLTALDDAPEAVRGRAA